MISRRLFRSYTAWVASNAWSERLVRSLRPIDNSRHNVGAATEASCQEIGTDGVGYGRIDAAKSLIRTGYTDLAGVKIL